MAIFDPESGNLILKIVYDGAPYSGKTASIRTLGQQLGREVTTPAEREGRTLLFDWLEYEGGRCLDRPIQCRVISVPGQVELARRREAILEGADAVIFVADSTPRGFSAGLRPLADLRRHIARRQRDIPVLLQLNKRDQEDALAADEILHQLDRAFFQRHVESVATEGEGVRETFVIAVSEALKSLRQSNSLRRRLNSEFDTQEMALPSREDMEQLLQGLAPQPESSPPSPTAPEKISLARPPASAQ